MMTQKLTTAEDLFKALEALGEDARQQMLLNVVAFDDESAIGSDQFPDADSDNPVEVGIYFCCDEVRGCEIVEVVDWERSY